MRLHNSGQSCISPNMMLPPTGRAFSRWAAAAPAAGFKLTSCAAKANTDWLECRRRLGLKHIRLQRGERVGELWREDLRRESCLGAWRFAVCRRCGGGAIGLGPAG